MSDRIKFKDSQWKTGVEIPDGLITPSATNIYKLLEALNIDWQNCTIPNAKRITKWNGANVDPNKRDEETGDFIKFNQYKQDILDANSTEDINNHVDWINSNYDYLSESIDPSTIENEYVKNLLPRWYKDGTVKDSIDVVDILNYLLWRVAAIDYYTDHWDSRNGAQTDFKGIIYWDRDCSVDPIANLINNIGYYDNSLFGEQIIKLKPNSERNYFNLSQTEAVITIYNYYKENNEENYIHSVLASTNPCQDFYVSLNINENEQNIINFTSEDIVYLDDIPRINDGNKDWYLYQLNAEIKGTGNYYSINDWYYDIMQNPNFSDDEYNCIYFDPYETSVDIKITQPQGADGTTTFVEKEDRINLKIQKQDNKVKSFKFGNTEEALDIVAYKENNPRDLIYGCEEHPLNITNTENKIGKIYRFNGIQKKEEDNPKTISIPYFINDEYSKYKLNFELEYGEEYGIHPYFFLSGDEKRFDLDENNLFEKYVSGNDPTDDNTNSDGKIIKEDNEYYYVPPIEEPNSSDVDKIVTIYCIFYYADDDRPRQITPTIVTFKLKLNKEITNSVYFRDESSETFTCYDQDTDSFIPTAITGWYGVKRNSVADNYDPFVNLGNSYFNKGKDNNSNNVSYCFRTIYYGQSFLYTDEDNKLQYTSNIFLDDCIFTNCRTEKYKPNDFNIEYLGYIESDTTIRSIYLVENENQEEEKYDLENSYLNINNTDSGKSYNKLTINHQKNLKVGEEPDKTFYYCNKDQEIWQSYYTANKGFINSLSIEPKPENDEDIEIDYKPNAEILEPGDDILNYNYEIHEDPDGEFCTLGERTYGENKRRFVISIKKSTAIYDDKNGIFNNGTEENQNWVNADRDYYYLVFRIEVKSGQIGSYSYTPCKAYYFLKVLRNTNQNIGSSTESPGDKYITYYVSDGQNDIFHSNIRRFKMVPRIPIYLNRLFSSETQNILLSSNPKIYWEFYGAGQSDVAQLQESNLCISNNGEQFIQIYNEGDNCPFKQYVREDHINKEYDFYPEWNKTISSDGNNEIIQKFSSNHSGAILYVNKLVKKTIDDQLIPVDKTSIEIPLMYAIGNSAKYGRLINNSTPFFAFIYKKNLDIDIVENISTSGNVNTKSISEYSMISKKLYIKRGYPTIDNLSMLPTRDGSYDIRWPIHVVSTEFGNDYHEQIILGDALQITQDPETAINRLAIPGYNFKFDIDSNNISNNNWYINANSITFDSDKLINIYYFKQNDDLETIDRFAINIFGIQLTQGTIQLEFRITGDDDGIYNNKTIQTLVSVIDIPQPEEP